MALPQANIVSNEFIEINRLKNLIKQLEEEGQGWPNVILNVKTDCNYRPDVKGPLSLFMNVNGATHCEVNGHRVRVDSQNYFLTNSQETYTLDIGNQGPIETFNIHFGDAFSESILKGLAQNRLTDLDSPDKEGAIPRFFSRLYQKDHQLEHMIMDIYHSQHILSNDELLLEEKLADILAYLIHQHNNEVMKLTTLSSEKISTREETYKRISRSVDYIHSHYEENIKLETLAQIACMSRYHFLRSFKEVMKLSPHQYIIRLQLNRAKQLLKTQKDISSVAYQVGFNDLSSFSRSFKKFTGVSPSRFV